MVKEMLDRFGAIPQQVSDLFIIVRCRKLALELGFEKMSLKNDVLRCFFINRPDSPYFESQTFQKILTFIQTATNKAKLKQVGKMFLLIAEPIKKMEEVYSFLEELHRFCFIMNNHT